MQAIELVVFDMAGTVVDEQNVVYKTVQKAICKAGKPVSLETVLAFGAGKEKYQAIKDILSQEEGAYNPETALAIFEDFKQMLEQEYMALEVKSYPGVEALLGFLRNAHIKVALNTGYDKNTAQLLLDKMKWKKGIHYDVLITADDVQRGRPNPDMIYEAMEQLQVADSQNVVKAGDSVIDIEEGKNANCGLTIGVTTGAHTREQLSAAHPSYVLDSLEGIKEILS